MIRAESRAMKLFTTIYHDARLLGHFLAHYRRAGVIQFFVAVSEPFENAVRRCATAEDITVYTDLDVSDTVIGQVSAATEMRRQHQRSTEWAIVVDLDEFVEFPTGIDGIIAEAESEGANVVRGIMWDRFARDGRAVGFQPASELKNVYPVKARFIKNLMGGADYKGVLVKGLLESVSAHHNFENEIICSRELEISHYKWTEGAIDRLRAAHRMVQDAGEPWAAEYKRVLDHYEQHGRFAWEEFGGQLDRNV
jgi:hypothetical protein